MLLFLWIAEATAGHAFSPVKAPPPLPPEFIVAEKECIMLMHFRVVDVF